MPPAIALGPARPTMDHLGRTSSDLTPPLKRHKLNSGRFSTKYVGRVLQSQNAAELILGAGSSSDSDEFEGLTPGEKIKRKAVRDKNDLYGRHGTIPALPLVNNDPLAEPRENGG